MCLVFLWMLETANCPGFLSETGEVRAGKKGPKTTWGLRLGLKYAKRKEQTFLQHFACPRVVVKGLWVRRIFFFFFPQIEIWERRQCSGDATPPLCYIPNPSPTKDTEATFGIIVVISWTRQCTLAVSLCRVWCTVDALFNPAGSRPLIHQWGTSHSFFCPPQMKIKESSAVSGWIASVPWPSICPLRTSFISKTSGAQMICPLTTESELNCQHVDPSYMSEHMKHITEVDSKSGFSVESTAFPSADCRKGQHICFLWYHNIHQVFGALL